MKQQFVFHTITTPTVPDCIATTSTYGVCEDPNQAILIAYVYIWAETMEEAQNICKSLYFVDTIIDFYNATGVRKAYEDFLNMFGHSDLPF